MQFYSTLGQNLLNISVEPAAQPGTRQGGPNSAASLSKNNILDRNPDDLQNLTSLYAIVGRNYTLGMR
jgi:hypothetical protein